MKQTKSVLNGKEINLTGDNTIITSNNFNVDKDGNMSCSNANIIRGTIKIYDTTNENTSNLIVLSEDNSNNLIKSDRSYLYSKNPNVYISNRVCDNDGNMAATMWVGPGDKFSQVTHESISSTTLYIDENAYADQFIQTSLAEKKKNFEKVQDNALEILKQIDIYKYNLKNEKDTDKKHIGFVIGNNYKYSKEVTSLDNKGVDNYSFTSLCCKAIQELSQKIEELENKLKEKEGK